VVTWPAAGCGENFLGDGFYPNLRKSNITIITIIIITIIIMITIIIAYYYHHHNQSQLL
jgi:flagellar basal body-associated protein FliL